MKIKSYKAGGRSHRLKIHSAKFPDSVSYCDAWDIEISFQIDNRIFKFIFSESEVSDLIGLLNSALSGLQHREVLLTDRQFNSFVKKIKRRTKK